MVKSIKIYSFVITEEFEPYWNKFRIYANKEGKKIIANMKANKNSLSPEEKKEYKLPKINDNSYTSLVMRTILQTYVARQDQLKLKELNKNESTNTNNN